ncbi:MAG: glutathione peroxidase [Ferruginibacter sp.]|nr:glutathione peroxidase [Ferruginibacter sp.]
MTIRQLLLKFLYPVFRGVQRLFKRNIKIFSSTENARRSFYDLKYPVNHGDDVSFEDFRNKKILLVNTASDCGFTSQYESLEKLYEQHKDQLIILAFPANDFKGQEKKDDQAIAEFCKSNYHVQFPVMKKSKVIKHSSQNEVYKWLTDKDRNGWNDQAPTWNFCKYLVDEQGNLTHFFEAAIEPLGPEMQSAIGLAPVTSPGL